METSLTALRASKGPLLVVLALLSVACQPKIGDDCTVDLDCSQLGDRVCDTTQPGGYCTMFNCDPTSCPEGEGICIAFNNSPSTAIGCGNLSRTSPYVRNFCMRSCEEDADCRDGYTCLDVERENPWGAVSVQEDATSTKVCVLPSSDDPVPRDAVLAYEENVCRGALPSGAGEGGAGGLGGGSSL